MSKLVSRNKRVKHTVEIGTVEAGSGELVSDLDARIEAIQLLIPLGLEAVREELQRAVLELAGPRYQRKAIDRTVAGALSPGQYIWRIRRYLSRCHEYATWTTVRRFLLTPTRPFKRLGRWTKVCCRGC